jgi:hypothetical protein
MGKSCHLLRLGAGRGLLVLGHTSLALGSSAVVLGTTVLLAVLDFLEGSLGSDTSGLGGLSSLLDVLDGSTNDGTLGLDGAAGLLASSTLVLALLVEASPGLSPHKLGGLLALVDHASALGTGDDDGLQ